MTDVIIDTNVAVVANRQNLAVMNSCVEACILFLVKAQAEYVVLIDVGDEIRAEYAKALSLSRPQGLGALFLLHILQHQFNPERVRRIDLRKNIAGEFLDFPSVRELMDFDRDDRKFAALAKFTNTAVSNAVDSDWADYLTPLTQNGITVHFVCGCDKSNWLNP
jgi:hypothetical protein